MNEQPTPGPWKTAGASDFAVMSDTPAGRFLVGVAHHGAQRTPIDCREIPAEVARANARIFAAGPQMLEALQEVAHHADDEAGFMVQVRTALARALPEEG